MCFPILVFQNQTILLNDQQKYHIHHQVRELYDFFDSCKTKIIFIKNLFIRKTLTIFSQSIHRLNFRYLIKDKILVKYLSTKCHYLFYKIN